MIKEANTEGEKHKLEDTKKEISYVIKEANTEGEKHKLEDTPREGNFLLVFFP